MKCFNKCLIGKLELAALARPDISCHGIYRQTEVSGQGRGGCECFWGGPHALIFSRINIAVYCEHAGAVELYVVLSVC